MKVIKTDDETERQTAIFSAANVIYEKTFNYSLDLLNELKSDPIFYEMSDTEIISFFANLYSKIFCHGFTTMLDLKKRIMKEHEGTEHELLEEWVQGIYAFLGQKLPKEKLPDTPIQKLKME